MPQNARTIPSPSHISTLFYAQFNTPSIFYVVDAFPSNTSRQFNAAASTLLFPDVFSIQHQFITSFHQNIIFIIPVLTTFLQLKYQGSINDRDNSPFATHPATMLVAVSSSVVYSLAYFALLRFPLRRFAVVAHHCLTGCGYATVASLASLLLPVSIRPLVYAVFGLILASELLYSLYHKLGVEREEGRDLQAYGRRIRRFLNNGRRVAAIATGQRPQIVRFRRAATISSGQRPQVLPI